MPGLYLIGAFGLFGFISGSLKIIAIGIAVGTVAALVIALSVSYLIMWLGQAHVEYRVYDDILVAYDRYLEKSQWVVPFEDIRTVSTGENVLDTLLLPPLIPVPFEKVPVEIERTTGDDFKLEYLEQPQEFVRTIRREKSDQSNIPW